MIPHASPESSLSMGSLSRPMYTLRLRRQMCSMVELHRKDDRGGDVEEDELAGSKSSSHPNINVRCADCGVHPNTTTSTRILHHLRPATLDLRRSQRGDGMLLRPSHHPTSLLARRQASPLARHAPTTFSFPAILGTAPSRSSSPSTTTNPSLPNNVNTNHHHHHHHHQHQAGAGGVLPRLRTSDELHSATNTSSSLMAEVCLTPHVPNTPFSFPQQPHRSTDELMYARGRSTFSPPQLSTVDDDDGDDGEAPTRAGLQQRMPSDDSLLSIHDADNSSVSLGFSTSHAINNPQQRSPRRVCVSFCPTVSVLGGDGEEAESTSNSEVAAGARSSPLKQDGTYHSFRAGTSNARGAHWGDNNNNSTSDEPSEEVLAQFVLRPDEFSPSLRSMQEKMRDGSGLLSFFGGFGGFGSSEDVVGDDVGVSGGEGRRSDADEDQVAPVGPSPSAAEYVGAVGDVVVVEVAQVAGGANTQDETATDADAGANNLSSPRAEEEEPPRLRRTSTAQYNDKVDVVPPPPLVLPLPPTQAHNDGRSPFLSSSDLNASSDALGTHVVGSSDHVPRASWLLRANGCQSPKRACRIDGGGSAVIVPSTVYSIATANISSSSSSLDYCQSQNLQRPCSVMIEACAQMEEENEGRT